MKTFLLIVLIISTAAVGGFFYVKRSHEIEKVAEIKQVCIQKYKSLPDTGIITDVEGFCGCSANIKRPSTIEMVKAGGRACMDQYGKKNLLKKCEDMNNDMRKEAATVKGLDCECFYDKLVSLFGDEVGTRNGTEEMSKRERDETVARAFIACKS